MNILIILGYMPKSIKFVRSLDFTVTLDFSMQEQQQKQLDLILAIGKTGKLWESKRATSEASASASEASKSAKDEINQKEFHQI